jgi:hypothetical protein
MTQVRSIAGAVYRGALQNFKVEKIEDNLENPPKPVVIYDDLPKDEGHSYTGRRLGSPNRSPQSCIASCRYCSAGFFSKAHCPSISGRMISA